MALALVSDCGGDMRLRLFNPWAPLLGLGPGEVALTLTLMFMRAPGWWTGEQKSSGLPKPDKGSGEADAWAEVAAAAAAADAAGGAELMLIPCPARVDGGVNGGRVNAPRCNGAAPDAEAAGEAAVGVG